MNDESIFAKAIEIADPEERARFLRQACGEDSDRCRKLLELLEAHDQAAQYLGQPLREMQLTGPFPSNLGEGDGTSDVPERLGDTVGPYKLLQQIGEGGFGVVYMADQTHPVRRRVALKVMKPGKDCRQILARFEQERQVLAIMDHPNIAKFLDAGTIPGPGKQAASATPREDGLSDEGGRPYFVMELVKGVPITKYCDDRKLTPEERLHLILPVCEAVQHAHQKGIIHRDLKPSNVLVANYDGKPVPKIIDFGIAKATGTQLTEKTLFTEFGAFIGTPDYMSPEQAELNQLDIDTRSDIYALGVLLYELLTGTTPLDRKRLKEVTLLEALRLVREEDPPKPSTRLSQSTELPEIAQRRGVQPKRLSGLIRGELDWIVMKCLEKERARRYEHASGLAQDLQRFLNGEPVLASAPSALYRVRKWVRRKPALAALLILAFLAPMLFVVAALGHAVTVENKNRQIARQGNDLLKERDETHRARERELRLHAVAEERARAMRRDVYAAQMSMIGHALRRGRIDLVQEILESVRPEAMDGDDLRGWEWFHLHQRSRSGTVRFRGHVARARVAAFSPDGRQVASGDDSGVVSIWVAESGNEVRRIRLCADAILCLAFSADGKHLAAGSRDCTAAVLDLERNQVLHWLRAHALPVNDVAFRPDGKQLATGGADNLIKIWDLVGGLPARTLIGHTHEVRRLWFHDSDRLLASVGADATLRFWNLDTNDEVIGSRRQGVSNQVSLSADFRRVAFWNEAQQQLEVIQLPAANVIASSDLAVTDLQLSRDGRTLAVVYPDGRTSIIDVDRRAAQAEHHAMASTVCLSAAADRVVSICGDNSVRIWPCKDTALDDFSGHEGNLRRIAFSADGMTIATGDSIGSVRLWDARTGRQLFALGLQVVGRGPDGMPMPGESKRIIGKPLRSATRFRPPTGGRYLPDTLRDVWTFDGHEAEILGLTFSPDGKTLASAAGDATVRLWDVDAGRELAVLRHPRRVSSVAFLGDGRLVTGCWDGGVRIWNVSGGTEERVLLGHTDPVEAIAVHPDGRRIVSAGVDHIIRIWDATTGAEVRQLPGHSSWIHALALSADGRILASGSSDGSIRCWDFESGALRSVLWGHKARVTSLLFLPAGDRLVSASSSSEDAVLHIWDSQTGREVFLTPTPIGPLHGIAFAGARNLIALTVGRRMEFLTAATPEASQPDPPPAAGSLVEMQWRGPTNELIALGFDRRTELRRIHAGVPFKPQRPNHDFLVLALSVPNARLHPTPSQHRAMLEHAQRSPEDHKPPGPIPLYRLHDASRFTLILPDGRRLQSTACGPIPEVLEGSSGFNDRITVEASTSRFHPLDRALIGVAWELPKDVAGPFQVRFDTDKPIAVPEFRLMGYLGRHLWTRRRSDQVRTPANVLVEQRTFSIYLDD